MTDDAAKVIGQGSASAPHGPPGQRDAVGADAEPALARVRDALNGLRFGQITITVHDGQVVQIERIERVRLPLR